MTAEKSSIEEADEIFVEMVRIYPGLSNLGEVLGGFIGAFNKEFPKRLEEERNAAFANLLFLFSEAVAMSSMGFSKAGIIEAQAILEEFSRLELFGHLSSKEGSEVVSDLLSRQSLEWLANTLRSLGALSKNDVKFANKLAHLRNTLAHRNIKSMRKFLKLKEYRQPSNVWYEAGNIDWIPYQLGAIRYMVHLGQWETEHPGALVEYLWGDLQF